jgi:hypothetical protein
VKKREPRDVLRDVLLAAEARRADLEMLDRAVARCGKRLVVLSIEGKASKRHL